MKIMNKLKRHLMSNTGTIISPFKAGTSPRLTQHPRITRQIKKLQNKIKKINNKPTPSRPSQLLKKVGKMPQNLPRQIWMGTVKSLKRRRKTVKARKLEDSSLGKPKVKEHLVK
jgi:hypothetical protein